MRRLVEGWLFLAVCLSACAEGPTGSFQLASEGAALPPGTLRGQVWRWSGERFVPQPGVPVRVAGSDRQVLADAQGGFTFSGLPVGPCAIAADGAGKVPCRLPAAVGVDRVPVVMAPEAPTGLSAGAVMVVGTLTDETGAGVPGGTVHCVDTRGGNRRWTADAAGCFSGVVAEGAHASASLMGYGLTADGRHAEGRTIQTVALGEGPAVVVAVTAEAVAQAVGTRAGATSQ